jgi:hypothetical protein
MSQQIQLSANTALSQSSHHRRARRNAANLRYALHSKMRAAPIKLLGLNLAIPFAVRSGFRCSGFRYTEPALPNLCEGRTSKRDALGVQGGAAQSSWADSVAAS